MASVCCHPLGKNFSLVLLTKNDSIVPTKQVYFTQSSQKTRYLRPLCTTWAAIYKTTTEHSQSHLCSAVTWAMPMKAQELQDRVNIGNFHGFALDEQDGSIAVSGSLMQQQQAAPITAVQRSNQALTCKRRNCYWRTLFFVSLLGLTNVLQIQDADAADIMNVYGDAASLVEVGVQFIYLGSLLVLLGIGSFLVVRQVLFKRELETAAKELQERVRTGQALPLEYYELGAVMLRKKFYPLASKYLEQAIKKWDGQERDLAQVYNALGFSCFNDGKLDLAISYYEKAVKLSPGYVTAWNNLGSAYEKKKDWSRACNAYDQALQFEPGNKVALTYRDAMKERIERLKGVPTD